MSTLIYLLPLAAMIWVIYDVWANNTKLSDGAKIAWTIAALFFSLLTAIIYYFIQKK